MKKSKTKDLVLAAILTAMSIIITYSPVKWITPFFSLTLGSHVPTMIAAFINPWVVLMTVIGNCVGYFFTIPAPNSILVIIRAASHIIFSLMALKMLNSKKINIWVTLLLTGIVHAVIEGVIVYLLTPIILPDSTVVLMTAAGTATFGTFVHHLVDAAITQVIVFALAKSKCIDKKPYMIKK